MLVAGNGERIDEGPADVVSDAKNSSGPGSRSSTACPAFRATRMGSSKNATRCTTRKTCSARPGRPCRPYYRPRNQLQKVFEADNVKFTAALKECYKDFAPPTDLDKEPIVFCHQEFDRPVDLRKAAHELEVDVDFLRPAIKANGNLRPILSALENEGTISRVNWERIFLTVVEELAIGTRNGKP